MYNIGIIGIGFIGGSLIKSLSKSNKVKNIIAFDVNEDSLKLAYNEGTITEYTLEINEKFSNCDIVFICTPVSYIADYAKKLENIVKEDCILTDIGSTKKTIMQNVKDLKIEFIGGHPMVGSERSGYQTSKEFLFENSYYIITKNKNNKESSIEKLKDIILELRAIPIIIQADKHDYITSVISHVPHVVASTLVNMVKDLDDEEQLMKTIAAGGFKDITRIASSDPTMWSNICEENKDEIIKNLRIFVSMINNFVDEIENKQKVYNYFESSKKYRDSFINKKVNGNTMPELNINIKDENGAIAKIATLLSDNNIGIKNIEVINNRENNYGALKLIVNNYNELDSAYKILTDNNYDVIKRL